MATLLDPRWHRRVEAGRAGRVGVHVGGDLEALGPGRLDPLDDLVELVPVGLTGGLEVVDLGWYAGLPCNRDQFVDRLEQAVPLATQVRDVRAAVARRDLA